MRFRILAFIWFAALAVAPITLSADSGCCDQAMACAKPAANGCDEKPCDMPCCNGHAGHAVDPIEPSAVEMLLAMDPHAIWAAAAEGAPVRQTAIVWFHRPVWVGDSVLMGKYVIEHDTDRQARGEPCTHIYAAGDLTVPLATFHCTHLDRHVVEKDTVVLQSLADGTRKLQEFQFAGEPAAHGFPTDR